MACKKSGVRIPSAPLFPARRFRSSAVVDSLQSAATLSDCQEPVVSKSPLRKRYASAGRAPFLAASPPVAETSSPCCALPSHEAVEAPGVGCSAGLEGADHRPERQGPSLCSTPELRPSTSAFCAAAAGTSACRVQRPPSPDPVGATDPLGGTGRARRAARPFLWCEELSAGYVRRRSMS